MECGCECSLKRVYGFWWPWEGLSLAPSPSSSTSSAYVGFVCLAPCALLGKVFLNGNKSNDISKNIYPYLTPALCPVTVCFNYCCTHFLNNLRKRYEGVHANNAITPQNPEKNTKETARTARRKNNFSWEKDCDKEDATCSPEQYGSEYWMECGLSTYDNINLDNVAGNEELWIGDTGASTRLTQSANGM